MCGMILADDVATATERGVVARFAAAGRGPAPRGAQMRRSRAAPTGPRIATGCDFYI